MRMKIIVTGLAISFSLLLYAQQVVLVSGDLKFLDRETELLIKYDYDDMAVGKYDKELDYVEEVVNNKNKEKPGRGDEWCEDWFNNRTEKFNPAFESALNKKLKKRGIVIGSIFEDAIYTLVIKIVKMEPGYTYFQNEESPSISVKFIFVESDNPENELAQIVMPICRGPYGSRLEDKLKLAYTRCGTALGEYLIEHAFAK